MGDPLIIHPIKVLLIEQNPAQVAMLRAALDKDTLDTFSLTCVECVDSGVTESLEDFDVILLDVDIPSAERFAVLEQVCLQAPDVPVVACSSGADERDAILAVRAGAQDFLIKTPEGCAAAARVIRLAIERQRLFRQQELGQSQDMLQTVIDTIPVRVFWKDRDLRFLGCNQLFAEDAGMRGPQDLLGRDDYAMVWREQADLYRKDDRQVIEACSPKMDILEPHSNPDGSMSWINTSKAPLYNSRGEVTGVLGVYEDVTERRQAEALVAAQRDLARSLRTVSSGQEAWPRCLEAALRVSGMDSGGIYLLNEPRQAFELVYHQGLGEDFVAGVARYSKDSPNVQVVLADQAAYFDAQQLRQLGIPEPEGLGALAMIPIVYQGGVLGAINIASHTLTRVPEYSRRAVEAIAAEIGNVIIYLRANASLRESEEKYHRLVESQESAISTIDAQGVYHYTNQIGAALLGAAPEAIVGKKLHDLLPSHIADWQLDQVRSVISSGQGLVTEHQNVIPGWSNWSRVSIQPVYNADGQVVLAMVNSLDITDRKQAEEDLQKSQMQLSQALEAARMGSWRWDILTNRLEWSPESAQLFEMPTMGDNLEAVLQYFFPEDQERAVNAIQEAFMQGKLLNLEYRVYTASGKMLWITNTGYVEYDAQGNPQAMSGLIQDITEQKLAREELEKSRASLEMAQAVANLGSWELDPLSGQGLLWSKEMFRLFQRDPARGVPVLAEFMEWVHPADRQPLLDAQQRAIDTGEDVSSEYRVLLAPGEMRFFKAAIRAVKDKQGRFTMTGTVLDITGIRLAFEQIRESEEKYRLLAENITDVIWILDLQDGRYRYASPSVVQMLGFSVEEMLALDMAASLTPASGQFIAGVLPGRLADFQQGINRTYTDEVEQPCKDGSTVWTETTTRFRINAETGHLEAYGVSRNIADRKRSEDEIRRVEQRYRALIENAPDSIALVSADGKFTYASPSVERIFGYRSDELLKSDPNELTHPDDLPQVLAALADLYQQPDHTPTLQYRFLYKNGEWRWIESTFSNMLALPGVESIVINFRDITERRQAEEALRRSEAQLTEAQRLGHIGHMEWNGRDPDLICSAEVYAILGLPPGSAITRETVAHLLVPEDAQVVQNRDRQFVQARADLDYEFRIQRPDGQWRWVHQHGKVTYAENGTPVRVMSVIQDITRRKEAEEAIRRSNETLAAVVEIEHSLAAMLDEQSINEILFRGILQVFPDITTLFISNFDAQRQMIKAAFGWHEGELVDVAGLPELTLAPEGQGLQSQVIRTRQPLIIASHLNKRTNPAKTTRVGTPGEDTESAVYVPMLVREEVLGLVQLQSLIPERFSKEDVWALSLIANTASVSIQNARLYERSQKEIAERRLVEAALRKSEAQLTEAQRIGRIGHIEWNGRDAELICSEEVYEILGLPPGSVISRETIGSMMAPEELEVMRDRELEFIRQRADINYEYRIRSADGTERWLHQQGNMAYAENGAPIRMLAVIQDITERKQAEVALRASEEKYRGLMESLDSVIATVDRDGTLLYLNDVAARQLGGSTETFTGQSLYEVFPKEFAAEQMERVQRVFHEDRRDTYEGIMLVQDSLRWYRTSLQPIHDEDGRVSQVLVNSTDIHDLKTIQQELLELNRTLEERVQQRTAEVQDLYENAPSGYHSLDAAGRLVMINQTELNWLGYTREEVIGRSIAEFITPYSLAKFREYFPTFMQQGYARDMEYEFVRKDGTIFPILVNGTAIYDEQGRFGMSRSTVLDITQRKQAEETLRIANLQMERALRLKDEFLANMSHELRTPLNAILGLSEILLTGMRGPLNERQQHYVRSIDVSGRHLLSLINDLLDVSKIESGKLEIHKEAVAISDICRASLSFVKEQAAKKNIALEFVPETAISSLIADQLRLKQILVNLLTNAVKFTPAKGQVVLKVHANLEQARLEFSVSDTGIGISDADLQRLFTPFTQVDSSLTRQYEGTGLGLALVKKLAELHGGEVFVTSEVGKGSCFTVALPWEPSPEVQKILAASDTLPQADLPPAVAESVPTPYLGKVLLAEDNEINLMSIGDFLGSIGYEVVVAYNGVEALEKADIEQPGLILMDIQMPEMDGLEAILRLRASPRFAAVPIIALTALAMPGDRERCLAAGADAYLGKPVHLTELAQLMAELLSRK